jgi:hypothetical protein
MKIKLLTSLFIIIMISCEKNKETLLEIKPEPLIKSVPTYELHIADYCLSANEQRIHFFIFNHSFRMTHKGFTPDREADGIPDIEESLASSRLDISVNSVDFNGDFYRDLVVYRGGFLPEQQKKFKTCDDSFDPDGDQLLNCEEALIGTDPNNMDTDGDLMPDGFELVINTSPLIADARLDLDGDGLSTFEEAKFGTPRNVTNGDSVATSLYQLEYEFVNDGIKNNKQCYTYKIKNIPYYKNFNTNKIGIYYITKKQNKTELETYFINIPTDNEDEALAFTYEDLVNQSQSGNTTGGATGGGP